MRSHGCIRNTSSSYFSALCNPLLRLRAPIHAENTWNNQMCFLSFFFSTQAQMYRHTQSHAHTLTQTQARHSCHVILLGIMPTAKHATYQKSLWDTARERERERGTEREREKFCTFASLWELLVKCKYSTYTENMKCSCYSYCGVGAVDSEGKEKKKEACDVWDLMWNCSEGTCHVYSSLS